MARMLIKNILRDIIVFYFDFISSAAPESFVDIFAVFVLFCKIVRTEGDWILTD